jgi:hypothetical protein
MGEEFMSDAKYGSVQEFHTGSLPLPLDSVTDSVTDLVYSFMYI